MKKIMLRILLAIVALVILGGVGIWIWLFQSKPQYAGELAIPGLQQPVEVTFDDAGVPHIEAQNRHDLYLAFGYIHAQDRLFQMEMLRRAGGGTLAEIIGHDVLKVDVMFRTLGLTEYAQESAAYLETQKGTPMYDEIEAYQQGINAFIDHGPTPPEFSIIGIEKRHFTKTDLYLITGAMSFSFSHAQKIDPIMDFVGKQYGDTYLADLGLWHDSTESFLPRMHSDTIPPPVKEQGVYLSNSAKGPTASNWEAANQSLTDWAWTNIEAENMLPIAPFDGSNAWAVSPQRTKSGKVLFCNDTHIGHMVPQTWYEAYLKAPGFEMYGHFLGGVPFALIGRNTALSWGITMLHQDDMDFYQETMDNDHPGQYLFQGEWKSLEVKPHVIRVKGAQDTTIQVQYTHHGPIINKVFDATDPTSAPLSMYWSYTRFKNRTVDALYEMNNASNLQEFSRVMEWIHAPGLNINYGDSAGNVAHWGVAAFMKRPGHVNPFVILDGTSGKDELLGFYPFDANPKIINPPSGFIYSANNWPEQIPTGDSIQPLLWYPGYYLPPYRADRIVELLSGKSDWDMESMKEVITDHRNTAHGKLMEMWYTDLRDMVVFRQTPDIDLYEPLFHWDGTYGPNETAPVVFNRMVWYYMQYALQDEMGEKRFRLFMQTHQMQRALWLLYQRENSPWWDDVNTEQKETRQDIIYRAWNATLTELKEKFGNNPKVWSWRKVSQLEIKHPLGQVALLKPIFNVGPEPSPGGSETIMQYSYKFDTTGVYPVTAGSQMRIIVDFAHPDSSLNITPCGQSGHVMSEHYSDQFERYMTGQFRVVKFEKGGKKLMLLPG